MNGRTRSVQLLQLVIIFVTSGCGQGTSTVDPPPARPHQGLTLRIACGDGVDPELVAQFARDWSRGQGVTIDVGSTPEMAGADIAIVRMAAMPREVNAGGFLPVPLTLLGRDASYQWETLTALYSNLFPRWNGERYGVPLLGEGDLMVYRKDRFDQNHLEPPATWEDFAAAAKSLGKNSLPALPRNARDLETRFHQIAACYDRSALQQSDTEAVPDADSTDRAFSYQYRLKTGEPRLDQPAFRHAFDLLQQMQPYRSSDPNAFGDGTASLAIVHLDDVFRFQQPGSPVRGKFEIAPLPGSPFTFDFKTGAKVPNRGGAVNRVPYLGNGAWIGIVSKSCVNPDVAFAFLAAFADPEKFGAEVIAAGRWGAGPFRSSQTEDRGRGMWLGFDLNAAQTERLLTALKQNLAPGLVNHRHPLRLPNAAAHTAEFDRVIRPALTKGGADPAAVMSEVATAWKGLWKQISDEVRFRWLQEGEGL